MNLFLDTSALIKLYHDEKGTEELRDFVREYSNDLIITLSAIAKVEIHSALMKKVRLKETELDTIDKVFELLNKDFETFNIIQIDERVIELSADLIDNFSPETNLRTLDSLQLASALISDLSYKIDFFASSDDTLLFVAKNYFPIFNPRA